MEAVVVDFAGCAVAGMEGFWHGIDGKSPDFRGQEGVEREEKTLGIEGNVGVKMGNLAEGVDS
jgi:hypothetical protein